ncbi:MAG: hypothetical protein AAGA92_15790 [Planctomycetota bacterium]
MPEPILPLSRALAVAACLAAAIGCGSASPFDYQKASGKLTYEDGTPFGQGGVRLQFLSLDQQPKEGMHPRPALAQVDAQGNFSSVTSYKYGDGLLPGRHKVAVLDAQGEDGSSLVPQEYTSLKTTPLTITTEELPLVIKVPKPQS